MRQRTLRPAGLPDLAGAGPDPLPCRSHLVVVAPADDRAGMVLRVPPGDRELVTLVQDEPLLTRSPLRSVRTSTKRPRSFSPCRSRCSSPASEAAAGSSLSSRSHVPRSQTMTSPPPYSPAGDHALEVEVLERVVLDVHRQVALAGVEGEPLRNCPAHQHTVDLEPEVVVQATRPVALHHEPRAVGVGSVTAPLLSGGFGRAREVALAAVPVERSRRRAPRHDEVLPRPVVLGSVGRHAW